MEKTMHTVLVYGDSNTYGVDPAGNGKRLAYDHRWVIQVEAQMPELHVIDEGLISRVAGDHKPDSRSFTNGQRHFEAIYRSHTPVDILIIALGTNDCWRQYQQTPAQVMANLLWYQRKVAQLADGAFEAKIPKVLYMLPPHCRDADYDDRLYRELITRMKQEFDYIDVADVRTGADGVHFGIDAHTTIAEAVTAKIRNVLSERNER